MVHVISKLDCSKQVEFKKLVEKGGYYWYLENVTLFKPYAITLSLRELFCNTKKQCV